MSSQYIPTQQIPFCHEMRRFVAFGMWYDVLDWHIVVTWLQGVATHITHWPFTTVKFSYPLHYLIKLCDCTMFWASWIQFTFWHTVSVRSVFVLPFHLCPSLPSGLFPVDLTVLFIFDGHTEQCYTQSDISRIDVVHGAMSLVKGFHDECCYISPCTTASLYMPPQYEYAFCSL
jgi:hypothetical protein